MMPDERGAEQGLDHRSGRLTPGAQALLRAAAALARAAGETEILPRHITSAANAGSAAAGDGPPAGAGLVRTARMGTSAARVVTAAHRRAAANGREQADAEDLAAAAGAEDLAGAAGAGGEATIGASPPVLAADDPVVDRLLRRLAHADAPLIVLVADDDVEPERFLVGLAQRLAHGPVPTALRGAQVTTLDARATAPASVVGQLRRLGETPVTGGAVLLVPGAAILAATESGASALAGALWAGIAVVTTSDPEGLEALRAAAVLRHRVVAVTVSAPTTDQVLTILARDLAAVRDRHGVDVASGAVEAAVAMSVRYQPDRALPGKARALLAGAAAWASMHGRPSVTAEDVATVVAQDHGIDPSTMIAGGPEGLADLEARLHARVVGQDVAVRAVADAIRRAETGVGDPNRPLGSFLFLGPTGVGKTELARSLAATLFGDEAALLRLDMGEFQEAHSVARLVGAPPGYIGFEQGGHLSEPLRRRPYSVVLLDEIEKAHPDVWNTLLAVLDEGRLTDGSGRTVDVTRAVLVMTSNLAGRDILDLGLSADEVATRVNAAVVEHFPPEFHSRVDDVVVFQRLRPADLEAIVALQLSQLTRRLDARGLHVQVDAGVCGWLAAQAHDSPHGARPLRGVIRRHVEDPLARAVLDGRLRRDGHVRLRVAGGALSILEEPAW